MSTKFHRNAPDLPVDPIARRNRVRWCQEHPLWEHPAQILCPPLDPSLSLPEQAKQLSAIESATTADASWVMREIDIGSFYESVHFDIVYVDPQTEQIEDNDSRNTAIRVRIEAGGWYDQSTQLTTIAPDGGWTEENKWAQYHDVDLDCGGSDVETAILELADRVEFFYDDWRDRLSSAPTKCEGSFRGAVEIKNYVSGCVDAGDGFCRACGYSIR